MEKFHNSESRILGKVVERDVARVAGKVNGIEILIEI